MSTNPEDRLIMATLIGQVLAALREGQRNHPGGPSSERNVRTVITRPMWNAFCRASGIPENTEPTEWIGCHKTRRVFGSETIVVESDEWWSASAFIRS
jgi:hypothetical protein